MRKAVVFVIVAVLLGLAVGYLIFARTGGGYVSIKALVRPSRGELDELVQAITGIHSIRRSILASGAVGAGIGLLVALVSSGAPGRRRR